MITKRFIILSLVILTGCSNPPAPKETVRTDSHATRNKPTVKAVADYWIISSFAAKEGDTEGRKFVRFVNEGSFSDSTQTSKYLYAEVLMDKKNAGIFLHKLKKSGPVEQFSDPVRIQMTSSSGQELQMTSRRRWNKSGGILIEGNNNDYSQLRIFLLQNSGTVTVEIRGSGSDIYHFNMFLDGFSDSFTRL
ncbi:MAG TPA: hypothetical protein VK155_19385 [Bacteroidales bacterium]|nr:hypothetical protein [Bacteroidales bacterium]